MGKAADSHVKSYRSIASSTAVFGGAQALNILVNLVRGKLVATILHSTGVGMLSLYGNASNGVTQLAMMGVNTSSVRNISQAAAQQDIRTLAYVVGIVRRLILVGALVGLLLTAIASPALSRLSFGSTAHTAAFALLGLSVAFTILSSGEMAILQGTRRYRTLAFCSTVPPLCGLVLSIPMYCLWGTQAIVPAMVVVSLIFYLVIRHRSRRVAQPADGEPPMTIRRAWREGRDIVRFGLVMTIGTVVGAATVYLLSAFISHTGSVADVGYYQSANVITAQYTGLIFTAMATDYYPHLAALLKQSVGGARRFINQQTEVVLLVITPLALLVILTAPQLITLLLTNEFQPICGMMRFMGLASIIKAFTFPMAYTAYAQGDKRYIFWIETAWGNAKTFAVMAGGYCLFGLEGLGYGALLSEAIDCVVTAMMVRWRYKIVLAGATFRLFALMMAMALVCFAGSFVAAALPRYIIMVAATLFSCAYCYHQLNLRMDIRSFVKAKLRRK